MLLCEGCYKVYVLFQLLQKNKTMRLGNSRDLLELHKHPFFGAINWHHLDERKVKPPYNPNVVSKNIQFVSWINFI